MTPWTFLGWLLLAALYTACAAVAWIAGKAFGLTTWLVPAVAGGVLGLVFLFAIIRWIWIRAGVGGDTSTTFAGLSPEMAALMPPAELAKRWHGFIDLLGGKKRPIYLVMGEEDPVRARLWRSLPECRYLHDQASGLALAVFHDALWIDVPARYLGVDDESGHPAVAAGAAGLWDELVRFLPKLHGRVEGVLILADPYQTDQATAANALHIREKLEILFRRVRGTKPLLWFATLRLEQDPGGRELIRSLMRDDSATELLNAPLGAVPPVPLAVINRATFNSCIEALERSLDCIMRGCDAGDAHTMLDRHILLLRSNLWKLTATLGTHAETLSTSRRLHRTGIGGVFLAGQAGDGLAFARELIRQTIPEYSRLGNPYRRSWAMIGAYGFVLVMAAMLWHTFNRSETIIRAIPFAELEASPGPGSFGGAGLIRKYANARHEINRLKAGRPWLGSLFPPLDKGFHLADSMFVVNLRSWLPRPGSPNTFDNWLTGLTEWVDSRAGIKPLRFTTAGGMELVTIAGSHSRAGRTAVARLIREWQALLDRDDAAVLDQLLALYDAALFTVWEQGGATVLAHCRDAADSGDFGRASDFLASDVGYSYVTAASTELGFAAGGGNDWVKAVLAVGNVAAEAELLGGKKLGLANLGKIGDLVTSTLAATNPLETVDSLFRVAHVWNAYRNALAELYQRCRNPGSIVALAMETYAPGKEDAAGSLWAADMAWNNALAGLQGLEPALLTVSGCAVAELLSSQYRLAQHTAVATAASVIEQEWQGQIVAPLAGRKQAERIRLLMDKKLLATFMTGAIQPFVQCHEGGIAAKTALGLPFPLRPDTLEWMRHAMALQTSLGKEYPIRLLLLPVLVNDKAVMFPRGIVFSMQNHDEPVTATAYNHAVTLSTLWSPERGGAVTVEVVFDVFSIKRTYSGSFGLVHFLRSLDNGKLRILAKDYPEYESRLKSCRIDTIIVSFDILDPEYAKDVDPELAPVPEAITM